MMLIDSLRCRTSASGNEHISIHQYLERILVNQVAINYVTATWEGESPQGWPASTDIAETFLIFDPAIVTAIIAIKKIDNFYFRDLANLSTASMIQGDKDEEDSDSSL